MKNENNLTELKRYYYKVGEMPHFVGPSMLLKNNVGIMCVKYLPGRVCDESPFSHTRVTYTK